MARRGGLYPCAMNAANEVAVDCFIKGKISFSDIYNVTAQTLKAAQIDEMCDIYDVYRCHKDVTDLARETAKSFYIK
jgi:1-deoxy-D-xylulose-5-phosphate reductoisomerase